jgi:hypothetical protein
VKIYRLLTNENVKKFTNAIAGSSLLVASIFIGLQSSAMAELVNVKLGDLGQSDWDAYCASKINGSGGQIVASLADTHVKCQVEISASGSTQGQAEGNATASGRRAGLRGEITARGQSNSQWQATFTSYQNSYHLNDWCRKKYAPNWYVPNPLRAVRVGFS